MGETIYHRIRQRVSVKLLTVALCVALVAVSVLIYSSHRASAAREARETELVEAKARLAEVESERRLLSRINAATEAESSALAKLARDSPKGREAADFIRAQTRRYLTGAVAESTKTREEIVAELCQTYATQTDGCY